MLSLSGEIYRPYHSELDVQIQRDQQRDASVQLTTTADHLLTLLSSVFLFWTIYQYERLFCSPGLRLLHHKIVKSFYDVKYVLYVNIC